MITQHNYIFFEAEGSIQEMYFKKIIVLKSLWDRGVTKYIISHHLCKYSCPQHLVVSVSLVKLVLKVLLNKSARPLPGESTTQGATRSALGGLNKEFKVQAT